MSQFTCAALTAQLRALVSGCYWTPNAERQKQSRENLEQQKAFLAFQRKQLESQIDECERRKCAHVVQGRMKEAEEAVRDKHKVLRRLSKTRELFDFTDNLLEQILDAAAMRSTLSTINEAQQTFLRFNSSSIYSRYAKMSEKFSTFQDRISETQDVLNSSMTSALPVVDDAELLAELETGGARKLAKQRRRRRQRHRPPRRNPSTRPRHASGSPRISTRLRQPGVRASQRLQLALGG